MCRAVTIPQAMKLNVTLTKKQSCDTMSASLLGFQPLTGGGRGLLVDRRGRLGRVGDSVFAPPDL
jgi:hypothetical protein